MSGWVVVDARTLNSDISPAVAKTGARDPARHGPRAIVVEVTSRSKPVPSSFFGLSIEYDELPRYEEAGKLFDRVISLIRPGDGSPLILRLGGKSADDAYWNTTPVNEPYWVFELPGDWLRPLGQMVRRDRLQVMLDANLAVHSPSMAASLWAAAKKALPRGALIGMAVGDEPDLFNNQLGLNLERTPSTLPSTPFNWVATYAPPAYGRDFRRYARALRSVDPGAPLDAPETSSSTPTWIRPVANLHRLAPQLITMHRYPFSLCWPPGTPFYPTIARLLGQGASAGLATRLKAVLKLTRAHHVSLRITEMNSISCGGQLGVANSFATALWAPDSLFELMRAGVIGVNWHLRRDLNNAPFHLVKSGIKPEPELYGLALFAQMLGPDARLMSVRPGALPSRHLKVWAVRSSRGLRVLLINKGASALDTVLRSGHHTAPCGPMIRLTAPAMNAVRGVRLAGQRIEADGRLHGRKRTWWVCQSSGAFNLRVPGHTAELLALPNTWRGSEHSK